MDFNVEKACKYRRDDACGYWVAGSNRMVMVRRGDRSLPGPQDFSWLSPVEPILAATVRHSQVFAVTLPEQYEMPEHLELTDLREYIHSLDRDLGNAVTRAIELTHWDREHLFCGCCGKMTEISPVNGSRVCLNCGMEFFPRISPAIIVRITRGREILLAHNRGFRNQTYSCIAGFVESGETFEDCLAREVWEEVGVRVRNIRYFDSQNWPFPHSLLAGFVADYDSGEPRPDGEEIDDVQWFTPEQMPNIPQIGSIARRMIDDYLQANQ